MACFVDEKPLFTTVWTHAIRTVLDAARSARMNGAARMTIGGRGLNGCESPYLAPVHAAQILDACVEVANHAACLLLYGN
ncbi:MAG: hypothetical protein WCP86_01570 [bacterium]